MLHLIKYILVALTLNNAGTVGSTPQTQRYPMGELEQSHLILQEM